MKRENIKTIGAIAEKCVLATGLLIGLNDIASAHSGALDKSFGAAGILNIPIAPSYETIDYGPMLSVPEQYDRTLFGYSYADETQIAAINSSGSLDSTFGTGGFLTLPSMHIIDLQVDSTNRVIAMLEDGATKVIRFMSDGGLDTSFGVAGIANLNVEFPSFVASQMVVGTDGSVFFVGSQDYNSATVAKMDSSGKADSSFGSGGVASVTLSTPPSSSSGEAMAIATDGSIFVTATTLEAAHAIAGILKFDPEGNFDTTFARGAGVVTFDAFPLTGAGGYTYATSCALDGNGNLVVTGGAGDGTGLFGLAVARILSDGNFDATFHSGMPLVLTDPTYDYGPDQPTVLVDARGKLILTATASGIPGEYAIAIRLNEDGTRDSSFGDGYGQAIVNIDAGVGRSSITHGGDIVMFGESATTSGGIIFDLIGYDLPPVAPPTHF